VGELERPGDVAGGVDVRVDRLEVLVGVDGAVLPDTDAEGLEPEARDVGGAAGGDEQLVESDAHLAAGVLADHRSRVAVAFEVQRGVLRAQVDALGAESLHDQCRDLRVLLGQQLWSALHLGHLRTQPGETLRQLAADGPAADHQQAPRQRAQFQTVSEVT